MYVPKCVENDGDDSMMLFLLQNCCRMSLLLLLLLLITIHNPAVESRGTENTKNAEAT